MNAIKVYLNPREVEVFRKLAYSKGYTKEWFDKWVEDCVVIVKPLPMESWFSRITSKFRSVLTR